jgi:hypothetical protein
MSGACEVGFSRPSHAQARPYRMKTPDALIITTLVLAVLALIAYANT